MWRCPLLFKKINGVGVCITYIGEAVLKESGCPLKEGFCTGSVTDERLRLGNLFGDCCPFCISGGLLLWDGLDLQEAATEVPCTSNCVHWERSMLLLSWFMKPADLLQAAVKEMGRWVKQMAAEMLSGVCTVGMCSRFQFA